MFTIAPVLFTNTSNLQACTPCHSQGLHVVQHGDRLQILSMCAGG